AESGLELPKHFTSPGIPRMDRSAWIAVQHEPASGRRRSAALADPVRHVLLPCDLVGVADDGSPVAAHLRTDRSGLYATVKLQALLVLVSVPREGAGPDGAGYIEVSGVGIVRHRRPVRAADAGRLDQRRLFPEGFEYA